MAYILNIETATTNCSVSLAKNGTVVRLKELNDKNYSHAENIHAFIKQIIADEGITFTDLSAVAVSKGPGSYTGLRIGVSTAKGICFAADKPLIAINTLKIIATQLTISSGTIISMLDARRMEVYSAIYNATNIEMRKTKAEIIDATSFVDYLNVGTTHFIGPGAEKCKGVIQHPNAVFYDEVHFPSAKEMAQLSYNAFTDKKFEDVAYFEPYYLKDFVGTVSKK